MLPRACPLLRRGFSRADAIVLVLVVGASVLFLVMWVTRSREGARLAGCSHNLSQIGFALVLFDKMNGHLPATVTMPPGRPPSEGLAGPLKQMLESLDLPDFTELRDPQVRPAGQNGQVPGEVPVPGFICASDPNALAGRLPAPVSYRATTGDSYRGDNGAFAPGRSWSLAAIEEHDGLGYTAAFSERLVGTGGAGPETPSSYRIVAPPLSDAGCPSSPGEGGLRDDAGSSWIASDYRSTLYNHALTPSGRPSCIADDGRTAFMGASSGHVRGVNVLRLDGSVSLVVPTIAARIWRDLAGISELPQDEKP